MKTLKIINIFFFFAIICMAIGCRKDSSDSLPRATQKGANTFGCYIDGRLVVKLKYFAFKSSLTAKYYQNDDRLVVECVVGGSDNIILSKNNPRNKNNHTGTLHYVTSYTGNSYFLCRKCNRISITKFDMDKRIVSGTFEFQGKCALIARDSVNPGNYVLTDTYCAEESTVQITKGRFDVKMEIY